MHVYWGEDRSTAFGSVDMEYDVCIGISAGVECLGPLLHKDG